MRLVAAGLTAGLVLTLAACGDDPAADGADGWSRSTDPVDTTGLVYEVDGVVHLGDGTTIDLGADPEVWVLAGDGVYFVVESDATSGPIRLATPDGVEDTGGVAAARSLRVSPDGRHLAFLDMTTGEEDGYGTPVATAVVVNLVDGEEVVRSADGMGDPDGGDDLRDLYEDASLGILAVTDDTAYVDTTDDGILAYDLATGDAERVADDANELSTEDWYAALVSPGPITNDAGTWTIQNRYDGGAPRLAPTSGHAVPARAPDGAVLSFWSLVRWLDDSTALGVADADRSEQSGSVLMTCTVPSGQCTFVPGTEGGASLPISP
jgi:hypothetical protein